MVGAQCATFRPPATNPFPPPRKPVIVLSSISNPFPSKPTKRKNHLRQKLLKTLTNPVIPKTPSTNCVIPFESPQEQQPLAKESEETQELQSLTSEATAGIVRGKFGNFPTRSVLLFLVGAFIFQAIRAVWASGLVNSDQKDENLDSGRETRVSEPGLDGNGEEISVVFLRGNDDLLRGRLWFRQVGNGFVGGSVFEERINEIRAMAREAREKERLDLIVNGDDNGNGVRTGIDMEVYSELVNLRKSLQKSSEKAKDEKKPLLSKTNDELKSPLITQLRSPLSNLRDKPKGFNSSDDPSITRNINSSSVVEDGLIRNESVDRESVDCENVDLLDKGQKLGNGKAKENFGKGNGVAKLESGNGSTQGNDIQRPLVKGASSSNSTIGSKVEGRDSDDKADLWWLSLPYVLVICCHDVEGDKGLFTLESKGDSSHTIAFEDQGDATNFCYLLQSSFEDLGNFSAEIVPVPTKELNEAGSSDNMKVIVVKKGELKLYAGQPLEEVEMALRSLVQ